MNASWRDDLLQKLISGLARLTLAFDPDALLMEERVAAQLRARGFELLVYEDSLAFHYAFAATVRRRWDHGEASEAIVIVPADASALAQLPYALVEEGRVVAVGLADLFPTLSYRITAGIYSGDLDLLWQAVNTVRPMTMGDDATADFILRHVYGIAVELVKEPSDLLRVLLRRHYNNQRIPPQLDNYLVARLRTNAALQTWPLDHITADRTTFLAFLQERWPEYLRQFASSEVVEFKEHVTPYTPIPGPDQLPFGHDDVRVYVDNLFLEGMLQPVAVADSAQVRNTWAVVGVRIDAEDDRRRRFAQLAELVAETLPGDGARHDEWLNFAPRWAELSAIYHGGPPIAQAKEVWQTLWSSIDQCFRGWLAQRYAGLYNQPAVPPVMVHHVARVMARRLQDAPASRLALLVLDGLALDQWHTLRTVLQQQHRFLLRESAVFAWIPTLTSVSRQAIFAGQPPYFFGDTIATTADEPNLWSRFWGEQGVVKQAVGYRKGLGQEDPALVGALSGDPGVRVLGLVIHAVDNIMHGMQLGAAGMHNQVRQWAETGYLATLLAILRTAGFSIWLTADHGNLETTGVGRPGEQALADVRGGRARIYPTAALCASSQAAFVHGDVWPPIGLPGGYFPLLAPGRTAFVTNGETIVGHGGAAIEEVIVPLIEIGQE